MWFFPKYIYFTEGRSCSASSWMLVSVSLLPVSTSTLMGRCLVMMKSTSVLSWSSSSLVLTNLRTSIPVQSSDSRQHLKSVQLRLYETSSMLLPMTEVFLFASNTTLIISLAKGCESYVFYKYLRILFLVCSNLFIYSQFRRLVILLVKELPNADREDGYATKVGMMVRLDMGLGDSSKNDVLIRLVDERKFYFSQGNLQWVPQFRFKSLYPKATLHGLFRLKFYFPCVMFYFSFVAFFKGICYFCLSAILILI